MQNINKKEVLRRSKNVILITLAVILIAVLLLIVVSNYIAIPCIFNKITGLQCPGCGNTRAAIAMSHLDFAKAFEYNPLSFLEFFYIVWVYAFSAINYIKGKRFTYKSPSNVFDIIILVVLLLWGIARNIIAFF